MAKPIKQPVTCCRKNDNMGDMLLEVLINVAYIFLYQRVVIVTVLHTSYTYTVYAYNLHI